MRALDTTPEAMIFAATVGAAVLLLVPEMAGRALAAMPAGDPRMRLGRQQLLHDRSRLSVAIAILAATLAAPLGFLTLLDTGTRSGEAGIVADVAASQVALAGRGGTFTVPPASLTRAVTSRVAFTEPAIQLHYLATDKVKASIPGEPYAFMLALDSPNEVGRLTNRQLSEAESKTLTDGGALLWTGNIRSVRLSSLSQLDGAVLSNTGPIPAATSTFDPAWKSGTFGVTLTGTARGLKLPISDGALVYTKISGAQAREARQAALDAGLDPKQVYIHESADSIYVPEALYAAAVGLCVVVLLTATAVAKTQVQTLRGYLGRLVTIGIPPRWARQVLLIEQGLIIGLSTALAIAIAIPPVIIAAWRLPGFVVSIPWKWLGLLVSAFYLATFTATLISSLRLRAADRVLA